MGHDSVKAILVAGGAGSRLLPFTRYTHKTLLPLHQRPVIDYALGIIRRAGIKDIAIIGNRFIGQIAQHIGAGLEGENIHYVLEEEPKGVGHALNLARPHVEGKRLLIYFSDNITSAELDEEVRRWGDSEEEPGAFLLGRVVEDPRAFGVGVLDEEEKLIDIVEKPENPPSRLAIGGIYLFDRSFWQLMDEEMAAKGDEFSITDVNKRYIQNNKIELRILNDEVWLDCGTPDNLLEGGKFASAGVLSPSPCNIRPGEKKVE
ncbi:MAG: sugar nucleotidyltransferase [Euryarchaeota archaeon]|jgi:glucose-1-phosphate thymidylyltransferase|nr:sugar nucleotidyltransferase [Euryarchaeota archaeon]